MHRPRSSAERTALGDWRPAARLVVPAFQCLDVVVGSGTGLHRIKNDRRVQGITGDNSGGRHARCYTSVLPTTNRLAGLIPSTPFALAGIRPEPAPSVSKATWLKPSATAAPELPRDALCGCHAFLVWPIILLCGEPDEESSLEHVLPRSIAPDRSMVEMSAARPRRLLMMMRMVQM